MKKLLIVILSFLTYNISSAQSGWGYVNYISYKTHAGNGSTNQYTQFANDAAGFDAMFNTLNSNTTITHSGEVTLTAMASGSTTVPRWSSDYFGHKFEFWFIPQETGTYRFGINSDDASDLSIDGTIITTYYGGHGAGGYQIGSINLIAGKRYSVIARFQEYGGGEAFYLNWSRPSAPNTYSYWNNEVTNNNSEPSKKVIMNFDFGSNVDKTKFSVGSSLSSNGLVDITNLLDSNKVTTGNKAIIDISNWESVIIYPYEESIGGHRLLLDERMFNSSSPKFNSINSLKLLDIYDGPVNVYDTSGWWKMYTIPTNVSNKIITSHYQTSMRLQDGWYAIQAGTNITYQSIASYKPQSITITTTNNLSTLYNSIVTVSDVWLAFKEVSNVGILGNQSGNEFGYGIQYKNGDVNEDGYFNEQDSYLLLQHLIGKKNLVDTFNLRKTLNLISPNVYSNIGKSNWNTSPSFLGNTISLNINTGKTTDTFYFKGTWKGDVNLSHSATPPSNGITTMSVRTLSTSISNEINTSIISEIINDKVEFILSVDPLQQELVGIQFQLNYDKTVLKFEKVEFKTKGTPTNFGVDKGDYINVGSLISDGSTILYNTTEYKVVFSILNNTKDILGLTSISLTDAVNKSGRQLKVNIK